MTQIVKFDETNLTSKISLWLVKTPPKSNNRYQKMMVFKVVFSFQIIAIFWVSKSVYDWWLKPMHPSVIFGRIGFIRGCHDLPGDSELGIMRLVDLHREKPAVGGVKTKKNLHLRPRFFSWRTRWIEEGNVYLYIYICIVTKMAVFFFQTSSTII